MTVIRIILLFAFTVFLSSSAFAYKPYISLDIRGMAIENKEVGGRHGHADSSSDSGLGLGVAAGIDLENNLRLELEYSISSMIDLDDSENVNTIMANAIYDFDTGTKLTPYLGLGAGYSYGTYGEGDLFQSYSYNMKGESVAYQGMAGIAYKLSKNSDILFGYSYLKPDNLEFKGIDGGAAIEVNTGAFHSGRIGYRYNF